jgi:hypothetical protein
MMADTMGGLVGGAIVGALAGLSAGLIVLVIGLVMPRRKCPDCGFSFPKIGPKYRRPGLAGGWICPKCKCEVDRCGRKIENQ